jgi:SSS family solute:Na+ symporter
MSKSVTFAGAVTSVAVGIVLSATFMMDTYVTYAGYDTPAVFGWLHQPLTLNYTWRGFWGTVAITAVLFLVSTFTAKTDPDRLARTTIQWGGRREPFRGLADWRLQLAVLLSMTAAAYWWLR